MSYISEMLLRELSAIVGEECWGVVGGEGTGSVILLHIGARTLRCRPRQNPHLPNLIQLYDSSHSLRIESPWRIESLSKVVSGSHMPNTNDGKMVKRLQTICGQRITSLICTAPAFDLKMRFENQYLLVTHSSAIGWDNTTCYSFGTPAGHYIVSLDGDVAFEAAE